MTSFSNNRASASARPPLSPRPLFTPPSFMAVSNRIRSRAMPRQATLAAVIAAAIAALPGLALAQEGPSLDVTLDFIREKLSAMPAIGYAMSTTDTSNNQSWVNQFMDSYSNVVVNASTCIVSYHFKELRDNASVVDGDDLLPLSRVTDIQTLSRDDHVRQVSAEQGHPSWVSKTSPSVTVLKIVRSDNQHNDIEFTDPSMAERLAKAFAHAAQLCGGLKPEAF